jgi:putative flippase GtrA
MSRIWRKSTLMRWVIFVSGGILNTLGTYVIYVALLIIINYQISFFIAYCAGIIFSYYFNSRYVFKRNISWKGLFSYPAVYLVQYIISALCMDVFVEWLHLRKIYAPLLISFITIPVTYIFSKFLVERTGSKKSLLYTDNQDD